jgi:hypothetical protein
VLATLLDPDATEFKITHVEMIKVRVYTVQSLRCWMALGVVAPAGASHCRLTLSRLGLAAHTHAPETVRAPRVRGCSCPVHLRAVCLLMGNATTTYLQPRAQGLEGHGFYDTLTVPIIENTARECELTDRLRQVWLAVAAGWGWGMCSCQLARWEGHGWLTSVKQQEQRGRDGEDRQGPARATWRCLACNPLVCHQPLAMPAHDT